MPRWNARHTTLAIAVLVFACAAVIPTAGLRDGGLGGDVALYRDYGERIVHGQLPYRDFFMEYPPGAIAMFMASAPFRAGSYLLGFKLLMLACALCTLLVGAVSLRLLPDDRARRLRAVCLAACVPLLLGPVLTTHYDPWPALLTAIFLALLLSGRSTVAFAVLGAAVAAKVYPVVLLPIAAFYVYRRSGARAVRRGLAACAVVFLAIVLPFLALGPGGVRYSLEFETRRPLQIESLGSAVLLTADHLGLYATHTATSYNSTNLVGALPSALSAASLAMTVASLLAIWFLFARGPRDEETLVIALAAAVVATVTFGKVLSPQYLIWLLPFVPLVEGAVGAVTLVLLGAGLVLTQSLRLWDGVAVNGSAWLILARDLALVALLLLLVAQLARSVRLPGPNAALQGGPTDEPA